MTIQFVNKEELNTLDLTEGLINQLWAYASPTGIAPNSLLFKELQSRGYIGVYQVYTPLAILSSMDLICEDMDLCDAVEQQIQGQVPQYPTNTLN